MSTKQAYIILYHASTDDLAKMVSNALADGYILAGPLVHSNYDRVKYQPMILQEFSAEIQALDMMVGGERS